MEKSKESMEATGMKEEQESGIVIKGRREEEVFMIHFICQGKGRMFFSFVSKRDGRSDGEIWAEESGYEW